MYIIAPNFFRKYFLVTIIFLYLFGGLFQHQGILTQTQTNYFVLFSLTLLLGMVFNARIFIYAWPLLIPVFGFLVSFFVHDKSNVIVYFYYYICFIVSLFVGYILNFLLDKRGKLIFNSEVIIRVVFIFLWLQLLLSIGQNYFLDTWISLAKVSIGYEDAISGSLYIQSDSTLGSIAGLFLLYLYGVRVSAKTLWHGIFIAISIVSSCNSFANKGLIFLMSIYILFFGGYQKRIYFIKFLIILVILFIGALFFSDNIFYEVNMFFDKLYEDYTGVRVGGVGSRWAPIGFLIHDSFNFFGNGPLTYYNPNSKEWLFNSGLSLNYSLFFDYGIFGLVLFYCVVFVFLMKSSLRGEIFGLMFIIVFVFSNFNFSLTDISFWIPFGFVLGAFRNK